MKLNLPIKGLKTKTINGKKCVFDIIRKKYLAITPEEIVRQLFIHWLIDEKKYPQSLLAVEYSLNLYQLSKRADIAVFNNNAEIKLIVECKAPEVNISSRTIEQATRYNLELKADYVVLTNGIKHYCYKFDKKENDYTTQATIPDYEILKNNTQ